VKDTGRKKRKNVLNTKALPVKLVLGEDMKMHEVVENLRWLSMP
jgi:hypothetical protein